MSRLELVNHLVHGPLDRRLPDGSTVHVTNLTAWVRVVLNVAYSDVAAFALYAGLTCFPDKKGFPSFVVRADDCENLFAEYQSFCGLAA